MLSVSVLFLCLYTREWSDTFRDLAILVKRIALLPYIFGGRHRFGRHHVNSMIAGKDEGKPAGGSLIEGADIRELFAQDSGVGKVL